MDTSTREADFVTLQADARALAARVDRLTRERDAALETAQAERDRLTGAMQQCEQLAVEVFAWRKRHAQQTDQVALQAAQLAQLEEDLAQRTAALAEQGARLTDQLAQTSHALAHAIATVGNMERSWFWRARSVWVLARRLVIRAAPD